MGNKATGRDYRYDTEYQASPLQKRRRAQRNAARAKMEKAGKVRKGDGKDVNHKNANKSGYLSNRLSNLNVESQKTNRGRK